MKISSFKIHSNHPNVKLEIAYFVMQDHPLLRTNLSHLNNSQRLAHFNKVVTSSNIH